MDPITSKMRTLKGFGTGKAAVMGKLKKLKRNEVELCDTDETEIDEWESFSRAVGIAISRIDEICEGFEESVERSVRKELCGVLEFMRDKAFVSEIKDMIDGGISAYAAVAHFMNESEDDLTVKEACTVICRILEGEKYEYFDRIETEITVSYYAVDVLMVLAFADTDAEAIVCVGERDSIAVRLADIVGLCALFISEEDIIGDIDGESAILYSDCGILFISPDINTVDDYTSKIRSESKEDPIYDILKFCCGNNVNYIFKYSNENFCGYAIKASEIKGGEEDLFSIYRCVAEISGDRKITVFIEEAEDSSEHLNAICRAAVYGKLSVSVSSRSADEYERFCDVFDQVCDQLDKEEFEFDERIPIGIMIDNISSVLLADDFFERADFLLIDTNFITERLVEDDKKTALDRFVKLISVEFLNKCFLMY